MRAALILALSIAPAITVESATGDEWPQWRGPERTGVAFVPPPPSWPEKLVPRWRVSVGTGHSSPVVSGGKVFQLSRQREQEVVRSLGLSDGKPVWENVYDAPYAMNPAAVSHGKGPKSTPLAAGDRLFTLGIGGVLSCFDGATGMLLWQSDFGDRFAETSPLYGNAMSPMLAGGKLLVHLGGPGKGALLALAPETGKPIWSHEGDGPGYASPIVANLSGIEMVVTQTDSHLVGVALESGRLAFRIPFKTPYDQNVVTPILHGERLIFAGLDAPTSAIVLEGSGGDLRTREVWRSPASFYMSTPVVTGDRLIGLSNRRRGQIVALDAKTGSTLWESEGRLGDNAALVLMGDWVLALTSEGELLVMRADASSFSPSRRYPVAESATWAHPVPTVEGILIKDESDLTLWSYR
jgi:outer membrane protein assembly factor BamB